MTAVSISNQQRAARIGILLIALTLYMVGFAIILPAVTMGGAELATPEALVMWGVAIAVCAIGGGLLRFARIARWGAVLLFGLVAIASLWGFGKLVSDGARYAVWDAQVVAYFLNAAGSSLLFVWVSLRAIAVLLDRERPRTVATARIVGAVLLVAALLHLEVAAGIGRDSLALRSSGYSIGISTAGLQLYGFPGWPIWHVGLTIVSLALLAGPRALLPRAAAFLAILFVLLGVLALVSVAGNGGLAAVDIVVGMVLLFSYLAWWLRRELITNIPSPA